MQTIQSNRNQTYKFQDTLGSKLSIQEPDFTTNSVKKILIEGHSFMLPSVAQTRLYWKVNENNKKYSFFFNIQNVRR